MLSGAERARRTPLPFAFWPIGQEKPKRLGFSGWGHAVAVDLRTKRGASVELTVVSPGQQRRDSYFGAPWRTSWAEGGRTRRGTVCLGRGVRAWLGTFMGKGAGVRAEAGR